MKNEIAKIIEKIEELGWNTSVNEDSTYVEIQKYSPAGQDFIFGVNTYGDSNKFIENIYDYYKNFDVSYEAYLWLGNDGHGRNGAPYDMKDVYEDMESCKKMIHELYTSLKSK